MKKRILFLMSDTGGGHRAAAQAIEEGIHHLYSGRFDVVVEDVWRCHTPWPVNQIPETYPWLIGPGLPLWKLLWYGSASLPIHRVVFPSISPVLHRTAVRFLKATQPDMVVSVHPLMNHLGVGWLKKAGLPVPFITVVTDLVTTHPLWFCPEVNHCIVPTEAARDLALKQRFPASKLTVCGQPVSLKFGRAACDKAAARAKLGVHPDLKTVLIAGGGDGFGKVFEIARAIAKSIPQVQLLLIAGRNRLLRRQLEASSWKVPTYVYGFVNNMPDFMAAADVLVTKAGPGTISEALTMELPLVLSGFIPGQEQGNVAYVQNHQVGAYADTPEGVVRLLSSWLQPDASILADMARNTRNLARPQASIDIARKVCEFAETETSTPETQPRQLMPRRVQRLVGHHSFS